MRALLSLTLILAACDDGAPAETASPVETADTSPVETSDPPEADAGCVVQFMCCEYNCWTQAEYDEWAADPIDCDVECTEPPAERGTCEYDAAAGTCAFAD